MDDSEILKVSGLARIAIESQKLPELGKRFEKILKHFKELEDLDTSDVEPLFHFKEELKLRPDTPETPIDTKTLLKNAPDSYDNCFKITRVIGDQGNE